MFLKSSVSLKQEIKYMIFIDFHRILYTVGEMINLNNVNYKLMHIEEDAIKFEIYGKNGE